MALAVMVLPFGACVAVASSFSVDSRLSHSELSITVTADGRLFANAKERPLEFLLRVIATEANFDIRIHAPLHDLVTVHFSDVPVDEAVRALLRAEDYILVYGTDGAQGLREVWVLERAERSSPSQDQVRPRALIAQTFSADDTVRDLALLELGRLGESEAVAALVRRLDDPDPDVRRTVVGALAQSPHPQAANALVTVLTADGDPSVRQVAASALASRGGPLAIHALRLALEDEVGYMRTYARLFLDQLETQ